MYSSAVSSSTGSTSTRPSRQPLFLYRLHLNEHYQDQSNWTDEAKKALGEHAAFLDDLGRDGLLAFAGRTQYGFDHPELIGISVIRAESLEAAQDLMAADPAVAYGTHRGTVHPFSMAIQHLERFARETFEPGPANVVIRFFERMEARDWDGAGACLADDAKINFTATGERFDGTGFLAMNRAYPEGWTITVVEVLTTGNRVAAQIIVDHGDNRFWCAGFYTVANGRITEGTEHWVTQDADEPPAWREPYWAG